MRHVTTLSRLRVTITHSKVFPRPKATTRLAQDVMPSQKLEANKAPMDPLEHPGGHFG